MGALSPVSARRVELKRMRVEPRRQGQGLGRAVLKALVGSARAMGMAEIELETTAGQRSAHRLYESAGFEVTDFGRAHGYDVVRYVKSI